MLQLRAIKEGFELKNSQQKVLLQNKVVQLDGLNVDSAGEYEAQGVEVVYGENACLIVWERIQAVYVFGSKKPNAFEKSQFSSCDLVLFDPSITALPKNEFTEILENYDPKVVAASSTSALSELFLSFKAANAESYKLAEATLLQEGREFILLG